MERTLKEMEKELERIEAEIQPLREKMADLIEKKNNLAYEINQYKINHKLYFTMTELEKHKEKNIESIKLIKDNGDIETIIRHDDGDIFKVDENGHIYYSLMNDAENISYSNDIKKYVLRFYHVRIVKEYIGFFEVTFSTSENVISVLKYENEE